MYTILRNGEYLYVYRKPTRLECNYYIRNGYTPPELVREPSPQGYQYARAEMPPNYPMPAIPMRVVKVFINKRWIGIDIYKFNKDHSWSLVESW